MALTPKQNLRNQDINGLELTEVLKIQLLNDATSSDEAVRLSQSEAVSDAAAQAILVDQASNASATTAFTSASLVGFLSAKQPNLEIDASSTALISLVDGNKLKVEELLIQRPLVCATATSLAALLADTGRSSFDGTDWTIDGTVINRGDVIILPAATDGQQRSWIHLGTSLGTAVDFSRLQADLSEAVVRAFISSGAFISYDPASGVISVNTGTTSTELGAQTLPIDPNQFSVVSGTTTLAILKSLELYVINATSQNGGDVIAINTRINSLLGVSGAANNLGTFARGIFPNNTSTKAVLQASEDQVLLATSDRAAIRSEFATVDANLSSSIANESSARAAADQSITTNLNAEISRATAAEQANTTAISTEESARIAADSALDSRLDIVEGSDTTVGSIAKAEKDAKDYTDAQVSNEANARATADANLQTQIDALQSAFDYKGFVNSQGKIESADASDPNDGLLFANASFQTGDFYKMNAAITISFNGGSSIDVSVGDGLFATKDIGATAAVAADFHKFDNTEAADIIREGMLDGVTIEKLAGVVKVVDGSIGRTQLDATFVAEHDDKFSLTEDDQTVSGDRNKFFITDSGSAASFNLYLKRDSTSSSASAGTQRVILAEHNVSTNGSGNALLPSLAHVTTMSSHYQGSCVDNSVAMAGGNFEANGKAGTAIYATGVYGLAVSAQNGINVGMTGQAENAGFSNIGVYGFAKEGGVGRDRGGYFAVSNLSAFAYAASRATDPIPYNDAAIIADAGKIAGGSTTKAIVAVGDVIMYGGKVEVPSASADGEAVNLGDIKAKEYEDTVTVGALSEETVTHSLGTKKILVQVWYNDEDYTSAFEIKRVGTNQITLGNSTGNTYTDVEVLIYALS